ncbi:MAG: YggT family protein [Actinomycetota bacterium]|nr:YggT family protein [Actinomycetota bacterium]
MVYDAVRAVVDPIMMPIRSRIPPLQLGGFALDLSPIMVIFGLFMARTLLNNIVIPEFIRPITG